MSNPSPRSWAAATIDEISATVRQAWRRDVFHYSFSLAAVQGGVFIAQLIVARLLGPTEFGYVRVVDTVLAILLVPAGFGLASAIVRWVAMTNNAEEQGALLSFMLLGVVGTSALGAVITLLILPHTAVDPVAQSYLRWIVWITVFTNAGRLIINYYQGRKEIRRVALLNVVLAAVGTALVVGGAWRWGVTGWASGRFAADTLLAIALLFLVRRQLRSPVPWKIGRTVMAFGAGVVASGALDRVATQADTLYLDAFVRDASAIGQYGAASLALNAATLLPAAAIAVALPYLSERADDPASLLRLAMRILTRLCGGVAVLAVGLAAVGPWVIRSVLGAQYNLAATLLPVLSITLVLGVTTSFLGLMLLALGESGLVVWQSAAGVIANIGANAWLMPRYGIWGAVWAAIITALVRIAILVPLVSLGMRRASRRSAVSPTPA